MGRPLYSKVDGRTIATVLTSYGLFVNKVGLLESPANLTAHQAYQPAGRSRWLLQPPVLGLMGDRPPFRMRSEDPPLTSSGGLDGRERMYVCRPRDWRAAVRVR